MVQLLGSLATGEAGMMSMPLPFWWNAVFLVAMIVAGGTTLLDMVKIQWLWSAGKWHEYWQKMTVLDWIRGGSWCTVWLMYLYMEFPFWWPWVLVHVPFLPVEQLLNIGFIGQVCAVLAPVATVVFLGLTARRALLARKQCAGCGCHLRGLHRMQWTGRWFCLSCYSQIAQGW